MGTTLIDLYNGQPGIANTTARQIRGCGLSPER